MLKKEIIVSVITHSSNPLTKEFWKWLIKRLLGKYSGPNAVEDSLLRGFRELNVNFVHNKKIKKIDIAIVLSGKKALREAIINKKNGYIKRLIAGPNITSNPRDLVDLKLNEEIDIILVPSNWVAKLWQKEAPEIKNKLKIWPAGVRVTKASKRDGAPVIYDKLGNDSMLNSVKKVIHDTKNIPKIFYYGKFKHKDYIKTLSRAPYLIYLSQSESQGLALQEAWAHDVPTYVNHSLEWKSGKRNIISAKINAPYLTDECGGFFNTQEDLFTLIEKVNSFNPKQYCDKHLSDKASAEMLLKLI